MFCPKCGTQAGLTDVYCTRCGTRLRTEKNLASVRRKINLLSIGAAVLILLIGGLIIYDRTTAPDPEDAQVQATENTTQTEPDETLPEAVPPVSTPPAAPIVPPEIPEQPEEPSRPIPETVPPSPVIPLRAKYPTKIREVDSSGKEQITRYEYDENGRVTRKETPDGHVHIYTYREDGTLYKEGISLNGEEVCLILCDEKGNPEKETDLLNNVMTYHNDYDNQNRLVSSEKRSATGALLEEAYYAHNPDGSYSVTRIDHADGLANSWTYIEYDAQGRILLQNWAPEKGKPPTATKTYTYIPDQDCLDTVVYREGDNLTRTERYTPYADCYNRLSQVTVETEEEFYSGGRPVHKISSRTIYYEYASMGEL